ncbi:class I SAM-dependent methyltransferase [Thomasclavelia spiroformis]|uniref:methyltransferase domain-containing protein n=1 Tax=Thomasclavelia spiroformis TaxID=29348 RepID=UPI00241EA5C7|nr:class I SAM-dependent methyltransferase [Thomasclavelia spiroformis]MBS6685948.1 class I SAM-dependent methyltransferase [Thomasclavelia spiroformis]
MSDIKNLSYVEKKFLDTFSSDDTIKAYEQWQSLYPFEKAIIHDFINKKSDVIEFGCGAGRIGYYVACICNNYVGVDIIPEMIMLAKKKHPLLNFYIKDVCETFTNKNKYSCVLFMHNGIDSIFPSSRRAMVFKNVLNILKRNGIFIYSTHLYAKNHHVWIDSCHHKYYQEIYHGKKIWLHRMSKEEAILEAESFGFNVKKSIEIEIGKDRWLYIIAKLL